jgi:hypothetical protein
MALFDVKLQCCDADDYRQFGQDCAINDICHGALRPAGDYLWFSVPSRFGLPDNAFVVANFLVAALGVFLSYFALKKIASEIYSRPLGKLPAFFLFVISAGIHTVFLQPTIFHTLSDPPASMMFLSGVWLLILAHTSTRGRVKAIFYLLSGVCLGFGAWLRAFNLYPVIACIFLYSFFWLFARKKSYRELLVLIALVPIGLQYAIMSKAYGTISYLNKEETKAWTDLHLNTSYVGFDTVFPRNGQYWPSKYCDTQLGILNGIKEGDIKSAACVIAERLYFYLGSYEPETYMFSNIKNQLARSSSERIGDRDVDWFTQDLIWEGDAEIAPDGQRSADRLTAMKVAKGGVGDVVQWVPLKANTTYTFSVWLWAPKPKTINLSLKHHWGVAPVVARQFYLTEKPVQYAITGTTDLAGMYDIDVGRTSYEENPISFGEEQGDFFYAWGAQLEEGEKITSYAPNEQINSDSVRIWKPWLLVANFLMIMIVFGVLLKQRLFWFGSRTGISILGALLVVVAQGVAIIPEQRFVISLMIFCWLIAALSIFMLRQKPKNVS